MKKFIVGLLSICMVVGSIVPAFAASGDANNVPVKLTAEAPTFSVTVPTALPINVSATGVVTTADNTKIVNNSHGAVKVSNMTISSLDSWESVDYDSANMAAEKVDAKKFALQVNGDKTTGANTISFTTSNFPKMDGKNDGDTDDLKITYDAKVPAQTTTGERTIANVIFTIVWDAA